MTAAIETLYRQASDHLAGGRLDAAAELGERILREAPGHAGALHLMGFVRLQSREPAKALPFLTRASAGDPRNAVVLLHLATAQMASADWAQARTTLERLLELKPDALEARLRLAEVHERSNDHALAVDCYRQLLESAPRNEGLWLRKGNGHLQLGEYDAAAQCYRTAIELKPASPFAFYNLSLALRHANRPDEARRAAEQALALRPDYPAALLNLGILEEQAGELESAASTYRRAIAVLPACAAAYWSLANLKSVRFAPDESAAMERLAQNATLAEDDRAYVHFALAKDLDDRHRYRDAFEQLTKANALKRSTSPYSRSFVEEQFAAIRSTFDAAFFARRARPQEDSPRPIFIVGMPRSGSTLIEQILASHSEVSGGGELRAAQEIAHRMIPERYGAPFPTAVGDLNDDDFAALARVYLERNAALIQSKPRFTDKTPDNFMLVGLLRAMFPGATFVHARRHPIDTCLSCYRQFFTEGQNFSYDLGDLAHYYRQCRALMDYWHAPLPGAILDVDYERLVDDQEAQSRRLVEFCRLSWEPACLAFHETRRTVKTASAGQVRQAIYRTSLDQWKNYEPYLGPLVAGLRGLV